MQTLCPILLTEPESLNVRQQKLGLVDTNSMPTTEPKVNILMAVRRVVTDLFIRVPVVDNYRTMVRHSAATAALTVVCLWLAITQPPWHGMVGTYGMLSTSVWDNRDSVGNNVCCPAPLRLLSKHTLFKSRRCNSFENRVEVDLSYGHQILKWVTVTKQDWEGTRRIPGMDARSICPIAESVQ